ncbi:MAG TPA: hypothetical protein VF041_03085 [Gemmatimonadaceae bacterium]
MTSPLGRRRPRRSSGVERVFEDDDARLWSAGRTLTPQGGDALLFTCLSDGRESARAIATPPDFHLPDAEVAALRALLRAAPRVGTL